MLIDLRSDTVTRPTPGMRRAMADAEVGDDVLDGDPTVRRLEERVADLLGKERALFFPTGTMANQTALWLLAKRGSEVLLDDACHILHLEMAGAAALAGVQARTVRPSGPTMSASEVRATLPMASSHHPGVSLICVENTHNSAGGKVTPIAELQRIRAVALERCLPIHLDGARLWNASAATGTPLHEWAACAETVMVSFSKGLGAPVGAALAGPAAAIEEGKFVRRRFGGGMRQSGILAAAALYGLEHHLSRLRDDHARAQEFAAMVDGVGGARVVTPDTNIVMLDLPAYLPASDVAARAARESVLLSVWLPTRLRVVTHLDVDAAAVRRAGEVVARLLEHASSQGGVPS